MARTYPAQLAEFFGALNVESATFNLPVTQSFSRTKGGDVITANRGTSLWSGSVKLTSQSFADANQTLSIIRLISRSGASFMIAPIVAATPTSDQFGIVSRNATVIASLSTDGHSLAISGLPSQFIISSGDFMSFSYGTNPIRYAFHQCVERVTANGTGTTTEFEVVPPIRPGAVAGAAVTLVDPTLKAIMDPGSINDGVEIALHREGISLRWLQTLGR